MTDRPRHAAFWFGLFYQLLSDFGRSLLRPIFWLAAGWIASAGFYLSQQIPAGESASAGFSAILRWAIPSEMGTVGTCNSIASALGLSLQKTLFSGFGSTDKLNQFYACLYGLRSDVKTLPNIPDAVAFFGIGQALFSAVLIFLFLLAVRNHFRIR